MIKPITFAALAALCLSAAQPALAGERRFEPASQWQVDNEPQICRLSREYKDGADTIGIRMEQFRPGAAVQVLLTGKPFKRAESRSDYGVRLGSGARPFNAWVAKVTLPDGNEGTLLRSIQFVAPSASSTTTWPSPAALQAIDEIAVDAPVMGTVVLQTKTLARAMEEMRKCNDQMVRGWGFDPDKEARQSRRVEPIEAPNTWLRPTDYPFQRARRGQSSVIAFRLNVDAQGTPTECFIPRAYTPQSFSEVTCGLLLKRARFRPALDENGQPVASYFSSSVSWLIR